MKFSKAFLRWVDKTLLDYKMIAPLALLPGVLLGLAGTYFAEIPYVYATSLCVMAIWFLFVLWRIVDLFFRKKINPFNKKAVRDYLNG